MSKDNENTEVNVLDELNKGACMGKEAIHYIMDKVEDDSLKKELNRQYHKYKVISDEIHKLYPEYAEEDDKEPHETNAMTRFMTWAGIEMKTMTDATTSHLAEILMQGTNMGIIEGRRLLNHKGEDEKVNELLDEYVAMQEEAVEKLKEFL